MARTLLTSALAVILSICSAWVASDVQHRTVLVQLVWCRSRLLGYFVVEVTFQNLQAFEYLQRPSPEVEELLKYVPKRLDFAGSDYFLGEVDAPLGVLVAQSQQLHVAAEFVKQAALDKEWRKAR